MRSVHHAAVDMFEAYAQATRKWLPNATLVYDRFHVQQLASKAVDEVARRTVSIPPTPCAP